MAKTLNSSIVLRNDTTQNWTTNNTKVLLKGEVGIEFTADGTPKLKIGDGTTAWRTLPYFESGLEVLSGEGAPNQGTTEGKIGQLYYDSTNKKIYICVDEVSKTWKQIVTPDELADLGAGDMLKSEFATNGTSGVVDAAKKIVDSTSERTNQLLVNDNATGADITTNNALWTANKIGIVVGTKVDKEAGKVLSTNDYTTEEKNKLAGIAAGAEVNVQADWAQTVDSADDFIKNKPTSLPADGGNADTVGGKTVNDAETGASYLWTAEKVKSYADGLLAANDAMSFKGVVNTSTPLPSEGVHTGDTYKVGEAGTYAGQKCEVGDMIICVDDAGEGDAKWQVIQTNIDGAVTSSAVTTSDGNIAVFDGTTGKLIKDGGATVASLQYTLPQATTELLGGVKASTLVTVTEGVLGLSDTVLLSTDEFIINGGTSAVE